MARRDAPDVRKRLASSSTASSASPPRLSFHPKAKLVFGAGDDGPVVAQFIIRSLAGMTLDPHVVFAQIDPLLKAARDAERRSAYDDLSDLPDSEQRAMRIRMHAAVERLAPPGSAYVRSAQGLEGTNDGWSVVRLAGILQALRSDYEAGHLRTLEELVHADLFGDFLDMAVHLLDNRYKDPAAVVAGSVLEEQLRKLAAKASVETLDATGRVKGVDLLGADLVKASVLSEPDRKYVLAWYGVRNKAAHGHGAQIVAEQVRLMIDGVRDFVRRHPA